jgi:hypothetical protein
MWWGQRGSLTSKSSLPEQLNKIAHAFDRLADELKPLDASSLAPRDRKELAETLRQVRETVSRNKPTSDKGK